MVGSLRRALTFVAMLASLSSVALAATPKGQLVLIGGGDKPPEAMRKFIELAGGPHAPIVVFPTASEDPERGSYYEKIFKDEYGCSDVTALEVRTCADASRRDYVELAERAGGFFFAGGDQTRVIVALEDSPLLWAITEAFDRGAVIGGTSAGTACQSGLMITGEGDFEVIAGNNVELWRGLGFFRGVIVDQHFIARRRSNRLISVILEHPDLLGVGIDEDTAIWVRPDDTFEVIGRSCVMVVDAMGAAVRWVMREGGKDGLGVHDLRVHVLLAGEQFDLARRAVIETKAARTGR